MMPQNKIYLDYAATTPVDPRVIEAMRPYYDQVFGNPSSIHWAGQQAEAALEEARETVAGIMNCLPSEVIFTSCGTESDNLAIRGAAAAWRQRSPGRTGTILISPVEHHAVSTTAHQLAEHDEIQVKYLPVDQHGQVDLNALEQMIDDSTVLVSVIYANNEIGTVNPLARIGEICRERGVPFHSDAVQAAGYLPVDVEALNVDLLALGAHKFYGPKGVGLLYVRAGTRLVPSQTGGGQEQGLRAGTHNIPYIVGMAEALRLAQQEKDQRAAHLAPMRDRLIGQVLEEVADSRLTGHPSQRLPNHASFAFQGSDGNGLLMLLDAAGFACSSGSACKTGNPEPSEVLTALGLPREWGLGSLRVTLGSGTIPDEIERFLTILPEAVEKSRRFA
jgi:cysteine desulfurase